MHSCLACSTQIRTKELIRVLPNTDYYLEFDGFGDTLTNSVIGYSSSSFDDFVETIKDNTINNFTFNTGESTYIGIKVNTPIDDITDYNIMLNEGTTAESYRAYKSPTAKQFITTPRSVGTAQDKIYQVSDSYVLEQNVGVETDVAIGATIKYGKLSVRIKLN